MASPLINSGVSSSGSIMELFAQDKLILTLSTVFFACAVCHTFVVNKIESWAQRYPKHSPTSKALHFLGEVEVVFGFWAFIFLSMLAALRGSPVSVDFLESINFKEVVFVFVIMCMSATRPIITAADSFLHMLSVFFQKIGRIPERMSLFFCIFFFGSLLGSFVTEPVAMTICAMLIKSHFFDKGVLSPSFRHALIALLFVNISIGGTLTSFAAPPILVVASVWSWDSLFMMTNFGWKSALAIGINTVATMYFFKKEILSSAPKVDSAKGAAHPKSPLWIICFNIGFLVLSVFYHNHIPVLIPLFLLFVGWFEVTREFHGALKIRESLLVGFFLGGIVCLGSLQQWWIEPLIHKINALGLFLGATALTAITDNAALTFLGTLIPDLPFDYKYALVAGAITGGGLTVIANAPNPIGYGILNKSLPEGGIDPLRLFLWALPFTVIAALCLMMG